MIPAIRRAVQNGHLEIVKLLLQNKRIDLKFAIKLAVEEKRWNVMEEIIQHPKFNPNSASYDGVPLLHIICMNDQPELLKMIIYKGADITIHDKVILLHQLKVNS